MQTERLVLHPLSWEQVLKHIAGNPKMTSAIDKAHDEILQAIIANPQHKRCALFVVERSEDGLVFFPTSSDLLRDLPKILSKEYKIVSHHTHMWQWMSSRRVEYVMMLQSHLLPGRCSCCIVGHRFCDTKEHVIRGNFTTDVWRMMACNALPVVADVASIIKSSLSLAILRPVFTLG